ncbi:MAG: hypothetical protein Q9219_007140 [cf. Caloplaca sp. 3 TL-2023]
MTTNCARDNNANDDLKGAVKTTLATSTGSAQQKKYYPGLGAKADIALLKRLEIAALGSGFADQIRQVYEDCCKLTDDNHNETWLFGFSRGAYVVRAVAGLLHGIRALKSAGTPDFLKDYKDALEKYQQLKASIRPEGAIHELLAGRTKKAPRIQFLGVFDTVKALDDNDFYDISFNNSIQHTRHAVALNEDRRAFQPELYFPDIGRLRPIKRSIVQAWFVGAHIDIGGSAAKDGIALYPLQWILMESHANGLALEFDGSFGGRAQIDDPLKLVLPSLHDDPDRSVVFPFETRNGIRINMQDLRSLHDSSEHKGHYAVHLNVSKRTWMRKEVRLPFNQDDDLMGYCDIMAQGTIIHPSVYLISDQYPNIYFNLKAFTCRDRIEAFRDKMVPENVFLDSPGQYGLRSTPGYPHLGLRASDRARGIHDIWQPITNDTRPDLIVHDSGGFESGGDRELNHVREFVKTMSNARNIRDRLHAIWFCLDVNSPRTQQTSTIDFFTAVSQNSEIPVIVVQTKKDEYWDLQFGKARKDFASSSALEEHANNELQRRLNLMEEEISEIQNGRYDAMVAVSQSDKASIQRLTEETARCFDHEKVRITYIAAQVNRVDLKVDVAIKRTMEIYRQTLMSTSAVGMFPLGSTTNRVTVAVVVCKAVVGVFGVPAVSSATVQEIIKNLIGDDLGRGFSVFIAECVAITGVFATVALWGIPVFLAAGLINFNLLIPATAALVLMLACDIILILSRAFKDCSHKFIGQPLKQDIEKATKAYKAYASEVHSEIKRSLPKSDILKVFQATKVKLKLEKIVEKYTRIFVEDVNPADDRRPSGYRERSAQGSVSSTSIAKAESLS